jgi:DNA mismatch endonuclease (patch repair protein)
MSRVKSRGNRSTELKMVALLRAARIVGWRRHLPLVGKPDFIFPKERVCVFVDGCFWHGCPRCYGGAKPKRKMPASNAAYWREKIARNIKRDKKTARLLRAHGYAALRVRECELKHSQKTAAKIERKLKTRYC